MYRFDTRYSVYGCGPACPCYSPKRSLATRMRNFAVFYSLITIGLLLPARADLTVVQKVEGAGQNGEVTVRIKGDKERIDAPSQPTRIIDGKTGELTDLLNEKKSFVRIRAEQMKAAAATIKKFDEGNKPSAPKLT